MNKDTSPKYMLPERNPFKLKDTSKLKVKWQKNIPGLGTLQFPHTISWGERNVISIESILLASNEYYPFFFFLNDCLGNSVQNLILKFNNYLRLLVSVWGIWILESYKSNSTV